MQVYGVVHLKSLPGSPSNRLSIDEIIDSAQEDVNSLVYGGVDGIIIENFGDTPFVKNDISKRTLAGFTAVVENLSIERDIKVGINVLRNDGLAALAIAEATKSQFVRINVLNNTMYTDQGVIEGDAHEVNQFKSSLNSYVEIYADVFVKHAVPPPGSKIENHADELIHRAGADVVIVTGDGTGHEINLEDLQKVRNIVPTGKLAIGSGVTSTNVDAYQDLADILIVGTSFKFDNDVAKKVDINRVEELVRKIK